MFTKIKSQCSQKADIQYLYLRSMRNLSELCVKINLSGQPHKKQNTSINGLPIASR